MLIEGLETGKLLLWVYNMKVYSFYEEIGLKDTDLINHWIQSWKHCGWTPIVLSYKDILKNEQYIDLIKKIKSLPTVNNRKYEEACFVRWLALKQVGGGILSDYDAINYNMTPQDFVAHTELDALGDRDWGCVHACNKGLDEFIDEILVNGQNYIRTHRRSGKPFVSDMVVSRGYNKINRRPDIRHAVADRFESKEIEFKPPFIVHYSNQWRKMYDSSSLYKIHVIRRFEKQYGLHSFS